MRLVTRAELRSVTCAGSMVTGSARRPMTMASLGGAAAAPDTRAKARITSAIIQVRRIVIVCSFGRSSCLNPRVRAIQSRRPRRGRGPPFEPRRSPRARRRGLRWVRGSAVRLEHQVPTVDDEGVAGVVATGVAGQVDGDA